MARAFVFPGQGSQAVGMGRAFAESYAVAREVFEEVDDALRQKLSRLMFEGPEAELTLTENAQPALMAVSLAALRVLEGQGSLRLADKAAFVAGHSLGEYSALAAAGALRLADAARLLKARGRAMQLAVPVGEGAMAALLGVDLEGAREIVEAALAARRAEYEMVGLKPPKDEVLAPANDNAPGQVVVSGHRAAVESAVEAAAERGKRGVLLPVSAPFHSPLMKPAAELMRDVLADVRLAPPTVPLVANVTAAEESDPETIRRLLVEQVTRMVRWRESVLWMKEHGVTQLLEVGAGKVLTGLARRIDRDVAALAVGEPRDLEAALKALA
jgi:[acyl-carrier-protein] S-malonyltransferase